MPELALLLAAALAAVPAAIPVASSPPPLAHPGAEALRALAVAGAGEPGAAEVAAAAAREADREGSPGAYATRARLAALLPRLTAEYRHDEQSYRVVGLQGSGEVDYLRLAPGNAYVVRATWDLGAIVADRAELQVASAESARARRREAAVRHALAVYFERRRVQLALLLEPPPSALARATAELEVARLGAELDAVTGGLFSRRARP
jgi:hypothetical protein